MIPSSLIALLFALLLVGNPNKLVAQEAPLRGESGNNSAWYASFGPQTLLFASPADAQFSYDRLRRRLGFSIGTEYRFHFTSVFSFSLGLNYLKESTSVVDLTSEDFSVLRPLPDGTENRVLSNELAIRDQFLTPALGFHFRINPDWELGFALAINFPINTREDYEILRQTREVTAFLDGTQRIPLPEPVLVTEEVRVDGYVTLLALPLWAEYNLADRWAVRLGYTFAASADLNLLREKILFNRGRLSLSGVYEISHSR